MIRSENNGGQEVQERKLSIIFRKYGEGCFNLFCAGFNTSLGYLNSYFYIAHTYYQDSLSTGFVANFSYGFHYGFSSLEICFENDFALDMIMTVCTASHKFDSLEDSEVLSNTVPSDPAEDVPTIEISTSSYTVKNASNYLQKYGLDNIW